MFYILYRIQDRECPPYNYFVWSDHLSWEFKSKSNVFKPNSDCQGYIKASGFSGPQHFTYQTIHCVFISFDFVLGVHGPKQTSNWSNYNKSTDKPRASGQFTHFPPLVKFVILHSSPFFFLFFISCKFAALLFNNYCQLNWFSLIALLVI